jgi:hypothetical protein
MNVGETDSVSALARVTAGKKKKPKVLEGQQVLVEDDTVPPGMDEREAEAEELVSEEFEDEE